MSLKLKKGYSQNDSAHEEIQELLHEILENLEDGFEEVHFSIEKLQEDIDKIVKHVKTCHEEDVNQKRLGTRSRR